MPHGGTSASLNADGPPRRRESELGGSDCDRYPDETTALQAEEEAQRLAEELVIQPDAIAAIVRTKDGKLKLEKSGIDHEFQREVRDLLQPGTSALFLVADKVQPEKTTEALSKYGGTVLKSSLSREAEEQLQEELHGTVARQTVGV
jgi:uncharacterized membrane protein